MVIEQKFDFAEDFLGGYAFVRKWNPDTSLYGVLPYIIGIIDRKGNLVTDTWYSTIFRIKADSFELSLKNTNYRLSKDGKLIKLGGKEKSNSSGSEPFIVVEIPPQFVGGVNAMSAYISSNINYPSTAKNYGVEGKVYVGFAIDEKGKVIQPYIVKGEHPILNKEAIRLIKSMPDWNPGTQNGVPVIVRYVMPLSFKLSY